MKQNSSSRSSLLFRGDFVVLAFVLTAVLYFIPSITFEYKKSIATGILALVSWFYVPVPMALGFLLSFAGDLFGDMHMFLPQLFSFAAAHVCYIVYFVLSARKMHDKLFFPRQVIEGALVFAVAIFAVVLRIEALPMQLACTFYGAMICTMMYFATIQRSLIFTFGAVLFVFSDFILAYNRFVSPLEYETYLIMVPYYLAQILLFAGAVKPRR